MNRSGAAAADHHQSTSSIYFADPNDVHQRNHRRRSTASDNDANSLRSERLNRRTVKVNHFLVPAFFLECAILACLAAFAYYLRFTSTFKGHRRLIPCTDLYGLDYPHYDSDDGDHDSAVVYIDRTTLYCFSALLPVGLIVLSEIIFWLFSPSDRKTVSTIAKSFRIPLVIRRIVRFVGTFWMGAMIVSILTDSMKLLSGRPRPYFLTVCNVTSVCSLGHPFVTVDDCHASTHADDLREAMLSFPSYFAALSSFAAVFCICYTQVMANVHGNYFLRPLLFGILFGMSLLAGYSRWTVYANHWEDLLVGYFVGSAFAVYISFGILNRFRENHAVKTVLTQTPEEPHPWFTWFALPRISTQRPSSSKATAAGHRLSPPPPPPPTTAYMNGNASDTNSTSIGGPNPAFQQEIHRRVEDFGRKNMSSGSANRVSQY